MTAVTCEPSNMANDGCPGVIVSSDRGDDVWPYATAIYMHDPNTWGCIFPWEFPQHGTREQEENFLRHFFSEQEIYMQGGADGEGRGVRFLKQVWYTIAIWNLEVRVPAVEKWFWQQEASIALLKDPQTREYCVREDSTPSTYFEGNEMQMYGEHFLAQVVPRIRLTARQFLAQQQRGENVDIIKVAEKMTEIINEDLRTRNMRPAKQESVTSRTATKRIDTPTQAEILPIHVAAPPTTVKKIDHPRHASEASTFNQNDQMRTQKRGGSGNHRYSNRGGAYHVRSTNQYDGRNFQNYSSPTGGIPAVPAHMIRARDVSGGPADFNHLAHQGQQFQDMHQQMHPGPQHQQFAPLNPTSHNGVPYSVPYNGGQEPVYYSTRAPPDYNHGPFADRTNAGDVNFQAYDNNESHRGARRNSMSGRGRGPFGSLRGRGGRGRSSFGASDQVRYAVREDDFKTSNPSMFNANNYAARGRRLSGLSDNWRSGHGAPQLQSYAPGPKENFGPERQFSGPDYAQTPRRDSQLSMVAAHDQEQHRMPSTVSPSSQSQNAIQAPPGFTPHTPRAMGATIETNTCGPDWISPKCTIATKLIAIGLPWDVPDDQLLDFFSQFGPIQDVRRHEHWVDGRREKGKSGLGFLMFDNAQAARLFLENKPTTWHGERQFTIEVAKEFWDPTHHAYQKRVGSIGTSGNQWRRTSGALEDASSAPTILRRNENDSFAMGSGYTPSRFGKEPQTITEIPSEETTPCASITSTPKKSKSKAKKKNKADQIKKDDLRKISLTANAEQLAQTDAFTETVAPTPRAPAQAVDPDVGSVTEASNAVQSSPEVVIHATQAAADPTLAVATDAQSSTEPTFSPIDIIKTQLPMSARPSPYEHTTSSNDKAEGEPRVTEACESVPAVHEDNSHYQPFEAKGGDSFRAETKTEKTATQTTTGDAAALIMTPQIPSSDKDLPTHEQLRSREAKGRSSDERSSDDTFHTASDPCYTPDSSVVASLGQGQTLTSSPKALEAEAKASPDTGGRPDNVPEQIDDILTGDGAAATMTGDKEESGLAIQKPRVTITVDSTMTDGEQNEIRTASGSTLAPLSPAFVTAPNTPAIGHETSADVAPKDEPPQVQQPEKADKGKGPAQTESLSLFGKKKDKKPKIPKKGSVKGRPNMDNNSLSAGSRSSSRALSGVTSPSLLGATDVQDTEASQEKLGLSVSSKLSKVTNTSKSKEDVKAQKSGEQAEQTQTNVEDTPSKRKGKIGSMILQGVSSVSSLFGGGAQSQAPAHHDTSLSSPAVDTALTGSKAQDLLQKSETKEIGVETHVPEHIDDDGEVEPEAGDADGTVVEALSSPSANDNNYALSDGISKQSTTDTLSLQIDTSMDAQDGKDQSANDAVMSKKKKKKGKTKQQAQSEDDAAWSGVSTSVSESKPRMFRFGENEAVPTSALDDASQASSATQAGDIDTLSPANTNTLGRKLPLPNTSSGHLVKSKQPTWKNKKRPVGGRVYDPSLDEVEDEEEDVEEVAQLTLTAMGGSDTEESVGANTPSPSDAGLNPARKIYVYVGPGMRSGMEEGSDGVKSKDEMRELAREELTRRFRSGM